MRVLSPVPPSHRNPLSIAPRQKTLDGMIWGFVDTSKVNADVFIEKLRAEISKAYRPSDFIIVRKKAPGFPLSHEQLNLLQNCACVIFCFGD
jgi:hypothetical protein